MVEKIKKITIVTKRLMQSPLIDDYLSAFKGIGLEFDQIREYQVGDNVRFIDWNSSAKMNKIMIKQFIEERDRTIILAIDVSSSSIFSSQEELRRETTTQIASALAFIATHNRDKIGVLFFSDQVEKWIPPSRGKAHYGKIIESLMSITPKNKKTNIGQALRFLLSLKNRNAILFVLSDWIDPVENYSSLLKVARYKFDMIGVKLTDLTEQTFPNFGYINVYDPETNLETTVDSNKLNHHLKVNELALTKLFQKHKIDLLELTVGKPFINKMIKFFHLRIKRQIS